MVKKTKPSELLSAFTEEALKEAIVEALEELLDEEFEEIDEEWVAKVAEAGDEQAAILFEALEALTTYDEDARTKFRYWRDEDADAVAIVVYTYVGDVGGDTVYVAACEYGRSFVVAEIAPK